MVNKQQGFSLIEVMISFILIGIGALGLVKMQTYIEQRADYALRSIEALHYAEDQLEWFRTRGASAAVPVADYTLDIRTASSSVASNSFISSPYTLTWTVKAVPALSGALKNISIQASWTDRLGHPQSVELKTMISKYSEFDTH